MGPDSPAASSPPPLCKQLQRTEGCKTMIKQMQNQKNVTKNATIKLILNQMIKNIRSFNSWQSTSHSLGCAKKKDR